MSLFHTLSVPWVEEDNVFGAAYAQAARNNLRAGLSVTCGVPATFYNESLPIPPDAYYVHHPVLFSLLVTVSVATLGEKEWAIKLVPILCSVLSAFFLWFLVEGAMGKRAAAFVVVVFVTLPMELHYGDLVDGEPCLVMWMLAALICLRNWDLRRSSRWAILAALCFTGALWTDWPGYLFTGAVAIWLFLKRETQARRFALLLFALGAGSAVLFLLQIHHVNPEAWSDLATAIRMRLDTGVQSGSSANVSSGDVRFGFWQWVQKILQALDEDYLRVTWILVLGGAIYLLRQRKAAGPRWLGWAALLMAAAGVPYLVILRNWSYVHDFASFFVIGSIAILGGLAIEAIWKWLERPGAPRVMRPVAAVLTALLLPILAWAGFIRAEALRSQFVILEGAEHEPPNLIRDLGRYIGTVFPADTTIFCNFDPYYSPLSYYAQRDIRRNVITLAEWKSALETKDEVDGGVIWLDAPTGAEIRATLPAAEISEKEIDGIRFAIWRRSTR